MEGIENDVIRVVRASDSVFRNSKSLFIEYIDIIRSPYFVLLYAIYERKQNMQPPFDTSEILNMSGIEELGTWFYARDHQNLFYNFVKEELQHTVDYKEIDKFLDDQIIAVPDIIFSSPELNMVKTIELLMGTDSLLVPKVYIYYPFNNPVIRTDIETLFTNDDVVFCYGDLEEVLKKIPDDSTYVFSDIMNVDLLIDIGKIDFSSVIIPIDYFYNRMEDGRYKLDFEKIMEKHVFKIHYFVATPMEDQDSLMDEVKDDEALRFKKNLLHPEEDEEEDDIEEDDEDDESDEDEYDEDMDEYAIEDGE